MEGLKRRYNITQAEIEEELASKRLRKKQQSLSSEKVSLLMQVAKLVETQKERPLLLTLTQGQC